jgi:hypothetical protein
MTRACLSAMAEGRASAHLSASWDSWQSCASAWRRGGAQSLRQNIVRRLYQPSRFTVASKGKKSAVKEALYAAMKRVPEDEELFTLLFSFADGTHKPSMEDRAAAIVGAAAVEQGLRIAITYHLSTDRTDAEIEKLFSGSGDGSSTLATFESRINMAFALGVFGVEDRERLDAIRRIRNLFAHRPEHLSFEDEPIKTMLDGLGIWSNEGILTSIVGSDAVRGGIKFTLICAVQFSHLRFYEPIFPKRATLRERWPQAALPQKSSDDHDKS